MADLPMPVGKAVCVLKVHMAKVLPRRPDEEIDRRRPGRAVGIMRMSGIDRYCQRLPVECCTKGGAVGGFNILD